MNFVHKTKFCQKIADEGDLFEATHIIPIQCVPGNDKCTKIKNNPWSFIRQLLDPCPSIDRKNLQLVYYLWRCSLYSPCYECSNCFNFFILYISFISIKDKDCSVLDGNCVFRLLLVIYSMNEKSDRLQYTDHLLIRFCSIWFIKGTL